MEHNDLLDDFLSMPMLSGANASPDGRWVAWNWLGIESATDVYAVPTDGSIAPIRLTSGDDDTTLVSWAPDSTSVIVREDHGGDERFRLFRVWLDRPDQKEPLTEPEPRYFLRGGQLHPNGRWLIYGMNFDISLDTEIEPTWLYRHDLETGERIPLARPTQPAFVDPVLNEQGTHILYQRQDLDPAGSQIWLVDINGETDREILNAGPARKVEASWFPNGRRVLFLAEAGGYRKLGMFDLGSAETHWLIDDSDRNIEAAFVPRGADPPVVVVLETRESCVRPSLLDLASGQESQVSIPTGSLIPLRPLGANEWLVYQYSSTSPGELFRRRLDNASVGAPTDLTRLWERTSLRPGQLTAAEPFHWRSDDGLPIQGWLYRAQGQARGTVVKVHGGPTAHSEDDYDPQVQYLTSQGFHVLLPNYRGSTGFGLAFQESIKEDGWGGREQDDIRAGIEALLAAGIAEPGKVGITGTSYGGYSAWCGITRWPPSILAAAAPICGMTDLVVDYETTRPDLRPYSEEMLGGPPHQQPERYHERSPIHFVENIRGRLLIVQGLRDPNVSPENVQVVRAALEARGIAYDILTFPDEGHGIYLRPNRATLYRRLKEFFIEAFET